MHHVYRWPLGGQQLHHLRQLRDLNDKTVREKHLKRSGNTSASLYDRKQPLESRTHRSVDAIVNERLQSSDRATSARQHDKVSAARDGIQSERVERPDDELRQPEMLKTTRKIVAIRRRGGASSTDDPKSGGMRRLGKEEVEWIEKQLLYKARGRILEKECQSAWQAYYANAGSWMSSTCCVAAAEVHKQFEDLDMLRSKDVSEIKHQLRHLNSMVNNVQVKVEEIANGNQYFSELQETIDAMEMALAKFRQDQLQQFEESMVEERVVEKALTLFMEKMASWKKATPRRLDRGVDCALGNGKLVHGGHSKSDHDGESATCSSHTQEHDRRVSTATSDETAMIGRVRWLNEAIIRSGGLEGGWDDGEHATFTGLLVKCGLTDEVLLQNLSLDDVDTHLQQYDFLNQNSNDEKDPQISNQCDFETRVARFLRKCMQKVVTQTRTSVRSHFEWYLRHLALVEEKKRVIQEWKRRKDEERQQLIQCGFDVDGNVLDTKPLAKTTQAQRDGVSHKHSAGSIDQKKREETERLLEQWKREKKQKEGEQKQRKLQLQIKRDALEAKRRQEQLDAKQKVLLYKLQKEQAAMMLDSSTKHQQEGGGGENHPIESGPSSSPTPKEELVARSRIAIESAKAKRLRLQEMELKKQKRQELPRRPEPKASDEQVKALPKPVMVFNATAASKARDLSKQDIQKKRRRRERQGAHDTYFPGMKAIPDVKFKSFGHIPIQPRAVPAWRKNI